MIVYQPTASGKKKKAILHVSSDPTAVIVLFKFLQKKKKEISERSVHLDPQLSDTGTTKDIKSVKKDPS